MFAISLANGWTRFIEMMSRRQNQVKRPVCKKQGLHYQICQWHTGHCSFPKITKVHSVVVLEAKSLTSRCQRDHVPCKCPREAPCPVFLQLLVFASSPWRFLACSCITPVPAWVGAHGLLPSVCVLHEFTPLLCIRTLTSH